MCIRDRYKEQLLQSPGVLPAIFEAPVDQADYYNIYMLGPASSGKSSIATAIIQAITELEGKISTSLIIDTPEISVMQHTTRSNVYDVWEPASDLALESFQNFFLFPAMSIYVVCIDARVEFGSIYSTTKAYLHRIATKSQSYMPPVIFACCNLEQLASEQRTQFSASLQGFFQEFTRDFGTTLSLNSDLIEIAKQGHRGVTSSSNLIDKMITAKLLSLIHI